LSDSTSGNLEADVATPDYDDATAAPEAGTYRVRIFDSP
jgi:hypothetical protein